MKEPIVRWWQDGHLSCSLIDLVAKGGPTSQPRVMFREMDKSNKKKSGTKMMHKLIWSNTFHLISIHHDRLTDKAFCIFQAKKKQTIKWTQIRMKPSENSFTKLNFMTFMLWESRLSVLHLAALYVAYLRYKDAQIKSMYNFWVTWLIFNCFWNERLQNLTLVNLSFAKAKVGPTSCIEIKKTWSEIL